MNGKRDPSTTLGMTLKMGVEDFADVILQSDIDDCGGSILVSSSGIGSKRGRKK